MTKLHLSIAFILSILFSSLVQANTFQVNGTGYLWTRDCQDCNGVWTQKAQPSNFLGTLSLSNNQWVLTTAITGLGNREYVVNLSVDENISYVHMTRGEDNCANGITDTNGECGSWMNGVGRVTSLFPIGLNGFIELSGTKNFSTDYWLFLGNFSLTEIQ